MLPAFGYTFREDDRIELESPAFDAAQIPFDLADNPLRTSRYLGDADFEYVSVRSRRLSIAGPDLPGANLLAALGEVVFENGANAISEVVGFSGVVRQGVEIGGVTPPPFTRAALDATCGNVKFLERRFSGCELYVENAAALLQFRGTISEATFLTRVLKRTGCGWLLNVANLYANARNHRFNAMEFLARVTPAAARMQIHVGGGFIESETGLFVPAPRLPIPPEAWSLYREALRLAGGKVRAVFLEHADEPAETDSRGVLQTARMIAAEIDPAAAHPA